MYIAVMSRRDDWKWMIADCDALTAFACGPMGQKVAECPILAAQGTTTSCESVLLFDSCTMKCDETGFTMTRGDLTRQCLRSGKWAGDPLECARIPVKS